MRMGMGLLIVLSLLLSGIMLAPAADSSEIEVTINAPVVSHPPIRINSNGDFPGIASAGDGSAGTPWIIENLDINGTGAGYCVYVGNTTEYFEVRNCSLYNASGTYNDSYASTSGLFLNNVSNGSAVNNTLYSNPMWGIDLFHSENITIYDNKIYNHTGNGAIFLRLTNRSNVIDNKMNDNGWGIRLSQSENNTLEYNSVTNSTTSYRIAGWSHYNVLSNNTAFNSTDGIYIFSFTENNLILNNTIENTTHGIRIVTTSNNTVYHNNFLNYTDVPYDDRNNTWDNGYPSGGNYWSNYSGNDAFFGSGQDLPGYDGIGDTPYAISGGVNQDNYPLMQPWNGTNITAVPEVIPPLALNYTPTGTNVSITEVIEITWNETMNWTSVEDAFDYTDGTTVWNSTNGSWTHFPSVNISTFTPTGLFAYETQYFVTVNCTATDIVGNPLNQDGNGTGGNWPDDVLEWYFMTVRGPPFLISTVPYDGQINVDPYMPLIMSFSRPMNQTSVEQAFSYSNATLTYTMANGTGSWNVDGTEFTFMPSLSFEIEQPYTVTLNGSMARSVDGMTMGSNSIWSFVIWENPPSPMVVGTNPLVGAVNVPVSAYINLGFDMAMDIHSVEDAFSYTDGNNTWDAGDGVINWYTGNTLFSFQPNEILMFDTPYTVELDTNASSVYGNRLDGDGDGDSEIVDKFTFNFTTSLEPPTVLSHYPAAGAGEVPVIAPAIYINFSKPMDTISVTDGISISPHVGFLSSFSANSMNLTLVLNSNLLVATQYTLTIMGTVEDAQGVRLDGNGDGIGGDRFNLIFSTEGIITSEKPSIVSVFPSDNAKIPIESVQVQIIFNQEMNRTSVEDAFSFYNGTSEVNGTFTWRGDGVGVRFMVEGSLEYNTSYSVVLAGTAKNIDEMAIGNSTAWQYVTESEEASTPLGDLLFYAAIIILIVFVVMLYMANRSLRMDLRKNRVKLKRAMKKYNFTEDDLKTKKAKPEKVEAVEPDGEVPEIEEPPEEIIPEENVPVEAEPVKPENVDSSNE
ncbi:MAG: Ig-like domain-containing protein [Thermoplasmata archaeon]|nr:Ig-like domain-containing protein [Thermoplasmata archaeon]